MNHSIRKNRLLQGLVLAVLFPSFAGMPLWGNPSGGEVKIGDVTIHESSGGTLNIDQFSDRAVIEWENFSIGEGELTQFFQPGTSSAVLNRVVGGDVSAINGALKANGSVWIINQNGVIFGPGSAVDVFGLIASTLDISDDDFMDGGDMQLSGGLGDTVNFGTINAAGGDVYLVGRNVANHGVIGAIDGNIGLAAGNSVLLKASGSERVFVSAGEGSVTNTGEMRSAMAELKAHGNVGALAINNTGVIRAGGASNVAGRVILSAGNGNISSTGQIISKNQDGSGGDIILTTGMGEIYVGGILDASGSSGIGGNISLLGPVVNVAPATIMNANGTEGGSIQLGSTPDEGHVHVEAGSQITANGTIGNGGNVDVTAGEIVIYGNSTIGASGELAGGNINLTSSGLVMIEGNLDAGGRGAVGNGGRINLSGENVLVNQTGAVRADGRQNGGQINVAAVDQIFVAGQITALGEQGTGGRIRMVAQDILIPQTGRVDASGATGGSIAMSASDEIFIAGEVAARGTDGSGGFIALSATDIMVAGSGLVDASGTNGGGRINIDAAETATIMGRVLATGGDGEGGTIGINGTDVFIGPQARVDASGATGGTINLSAKDEMMIQGDVRAIGNGGAGGTINVSGRDVFITPSANIDASGSTGGTINLDAAREMNVNGTVRSVGSDGSGGNINITGEEVNIGPEANIDASGATGGGTINIGGGFKGADANIRNAKNTSVAAGAVISANATSSGTGGNIVIWSDDSTSFEGSVSAKGVTGGGFIEVSGKENLYFNGRANTTSLDGNTGTLLLDPADVTIAAAATGSADITVEALIGAAPGAGGIANPETGVNGGLIFTNNVVIHTSGSGDAGNITIGSVGNNQDDLHYASDNSLTFLAHGDVYVNSNILNHQDNSGASSGHINIVAGWSGNGVGTANPVSSSNLNFGSVSALGWGTTPGSDVFINDLGNQEVSVGSRAGETNILGDSVAVTATGTREFAQIGYRNHTLTNETDYHSSGAINVRANRSVAVLTNSVANGISDAYAMIGHGGTIHRNVGLVNDNGSVDNPLTRIRDDNTTEVNAGNFSNDTIHKNAGIGTMAGDISVITDGAVVLHSSDDRTFAQIGHGGMGEDFDGTDPLLQAAGSLGTGTITVDGAGNLVAGGGVSFSGDIGITLTEALNGTDGAHQDRNDINVSSSAQLARWSFVKIGEEILGIRVVDNGTRVDFERGLFGSTISAHAVGDVIELVDVPDGAALAIATGRLRGTKTGNITVEAGAVDMRAGQRTNTDSTGDTFARIGHGGFNATGVASGDISVISKSGIVAHGSQNNTDNTWNSTVQIGHGGINSGAVRTAAQLRAGPGGPVNSNANSAALNGLGHLGAVFVEAQGGSITFLSGVDTNNFAQIGHGGTNAFGNHNGAMVSNGSQTSGALKDGITVSATGNILFDHHDDIGGGGTRFNSANQAYGQIGMGGYNAGGRFSSDIDIDAGGNLEIHGNTSGGAYAQIGNGGRTDTNGARRTDGDLTGDITIDVGGNLLMRSGSYGDDSYSQIGHGGRQRFSDQDSGHKGTIDVNVAGNITMETSQLNRGTGNGHNMTGNRNNTQIGHGGYEARGAHEGAITVNSGGDVTIETHGGYREYTPGNNRYAGTLTGDWNYGQIGHGGARSEETRSLDMGIGQISNDAALNAVTVNANGNITLSSADIANNGIARNDITVQNDTTPGTGVPAGDFDPILWSRYDYIQIGHGGRGQASGAAGSARTIVGDVNVNAGGNILMMGGGVDPATNGQGVAVTDAGIADGLGNIHSDIAPDSNYVRIGNVGNNRRANSVGAINVNAAGNIDLRAGLGIRNEAVIGSGGMEAGFTDGNAAATTRTGDITVNSGGTLTAVGSNNTVAGNWYSEFSYAQIGNDTIRDAVSSDSNITVTALEDVVLTAGTADRDAYAQIGSGGNDRADGNLTGTIDVSAGRDVILTGDAANGSVNVNRSTYTKIGHGARQQANQGGATRDNNIRGGTWNGDIFVKAGNDVQLADAFIGHIDTGSQQNNNGGNTSGNTFVASSRIEPNFLSNPTDGAIVADVNSGFSSAGQGFDGDLRLYMPNRPQNDIATGATLNGSGYIDPGATPVSLQAFDFRGDEYLDFPDFTQTTAPQAVTAGSVQLTNAGTTTNSAALATFSFNRVGGDLAPLGPYSVVNGNGGFYAIYYNNLEGVPIVVGGGSGGDPPLGLVSSSGSPEVVAPIIVQNTPVLELPPIIIPDPIDPRPIAGSILKFESSDRIESDIDPGAFTQDSRPSPGAGANGNFSVEFMGGSSSEGRARVIDANGIEVSMPINLTDGDPYALPAAEGTIGLPEATGSGVNTEEDEGVEDSFDAFGLDEGGGDAVMSDDNDIFGGGGGAEMTDDPF